MKNNSQKTTTETGYIKPREITEEMKESYIDYAMSVIVSRALPDVRDGLKPVHRRILYAMLEDGLRHDAKFRKSASVIGSTLSRYHPHGDMAVYDALVRMAQDFSLRYPLIQGQGNFGCFTKETKVRLSDGRNLSFGELIKEQKEGKRHWTFTFNPKTQKIEIAEIKKPRLTRKSEKIMEVVLDNREKIKCTLDHRFMLRNGSYKKAINLRPNDALMSFNQKTTSTEVALESSNLVWNSSLSSYYQYSKPKSFVKSLSVDNPSINSGQVQKALEVERIEPSDSWMISQSPHQVTPRAFPLYHNYASGDISRSRSNYKVIRIRIFKEKEDVYDLTCEPWHNFSLAAGIFVHNSIDGDSAAAYRYTEARLSKIGEETLRDIEKNTVDFTDNYDGTRKEPTVLPSPSPQLLLNGSLGIAVGMATNIPPHNLSEVSDAAIYLIDHPKAVTEDLFKLSTRAKTGSGLGLIQGPDFPTGGVIYNQKEIITAYSQGKGPIVMRGKAEVVEGKKGGRLQIIITEIPFQVQKSSLVKQFANLVQQKKIEGIKDIRDESDREGMRIVIELKSDAYPQKILNRLYKFSDLQKTFYLNMLALVEGIQPRVLNLAELLNYFILHRKEVVLRRTKYDLEKARERAHILEGLHKCLANIDAVIKTIKNSESREIAQKNLIKRFKLTQIQANAILETKLAALARLERKKIEDELKEMQTRIKELSAILKNPQRIKEVIKKELRVLKENFGDERKTKVIPQKIGELSLEDLIPEEETIITLTQGGYIKRINPTVYKIQKRGGKGILGMKTLQDDIVEHFLLANTHDSLLFFTDSGKVFRTFVYEIPEGTRVARGRGLLNFLEIAPKEKVLSIFPLGKVDAAQEIKYLVMVTQNGIIKKTKLEEFENVRKSGLIAITLKKNDLLKKVCKSTGQDEVILTTKKGQTIRFKEKDIREMGRQASGVKGIRLRKGDKVVGMDIIHPVKSAKGGAAKPQFNRVKNQKFEKQYLLVVTENGYGKRTDLREYRLQKRGGSGIKTAKIIPKTGDLKASRILSGLEEDLIVISQKGQVIRTKIATIPKLSRATQGVKIMRLEEGDQVASSVYI